MRFVTKLILAGLLFISAPSHAQQSDSDDEISDVVIASGTQQQNDPAMSAFLAGDFETAEIEFNLNAVCARRVERNFEAGLESAREDSIRANNLGDAASTVQPVGGAGGAPPVATAQAPTVTTNINGTALDKTQENTRRTCSDRGYQIYMKGMSQLQLGKRAEAQATLKRATKIKRTLFDAHFRLGLMAYQDGDMDQLAKELKSLRGIAKRCKRCQSKAEIEQQVTYLTKLVE